jgi:hypothetical protein
MDLRYQQRYDAQNKALDAALLAAKEAVQTALLAAKEAVIKAEVATENRLTLLNELRAGVATREQIDGLTERQSDLKERLDRIEGKNSGIGSSWSILIGAISVIATVIIVIVTLTS